MGDSIHIDLRLKACSKNGERFKMTHRIYKSDSVLAAWLDLEKRKLITPPKEIILAFNSLDRTDDFEEIVLKKKV